MIYTYIYHAGPHDHEIIARLKNPTHP